MIYLLRKRKRKGAFGFGGSLMLLGVILLAISFSLISGFPVWILTAVDLAAFAGFFYIAVTKSSAQ